MPWLCTHSACARQFSALRFNSGTTLHSLRKPLLLAFVVGLWVAVAGGAFAQDPSSSTAGTESTPARFRGSLDQGIPLPAPAQASGAQDAPALNEIVAHLKTVGTAPWTGMQGVGTITYGDDPTAYNATLSILGRNSFRLDAQTANGPMSIRIHGKLGKIQEADGHVYPLLPETAASGIFQFELPRMTNFPQQGTSLIDRGSFVADGRSLHRVTYESSSAKASAGLQTSKTSIATDFYFDSSSHLLIKSANSIHLDGARNDNFRRVITYEDHRLVEGSMIPFRFIQTLDGQKQWTLQLSTVQLNPDLKTPFFEF